MYDKDTILKTREKYLNFISEWPDRFHYKGKNFKDLFSLNQDFSLWWWTEMHKKDPEASPVFENLYRLENNGGINVSNGIKSTLLWYFLCRIKFLTGIFFKMLILKAALKREGSTDRSVECLFFATLYPVILRSSDGRLKDRNFLELPDEVEKTLGLRTRYISFFHGSILQLLKDIRNLKRNKIIFYEQYLNFGDLLQALDLITIGRYIFIERKSEFRNSFDFDGHNTLRIFRDELRASFVGKGICECTVLTSSLEMVLKEYQVKGIITFLEMYPYSRALYYSAKRFGRNIKTIAYQHASITPMKLWYSYKPEEISLNGDLINKMPIPDYFLFNGKMGKDILTRSGYPENRCLFVGSLRLDEAFRLGKASISTDIPADKKIVLVATTYTEEDSRKIAVIVSELSRRRNDCFFVFKGHSNYPIDSLLKEYDLKNYIVSEDNVYQLIRRADCLVTTYSTTAEEAIALGCPAVAIDTGALVNMSAIFEIEAAPTVHNADELGAALDQIFYKPGEFVRFKEKWPELIEASFYRLDGKAAERFLSCIRKITGEN